MSEPVPVLIYHGFYRPEEAPPPASSEEWRYFLPAAQFGRHLDCLARDGFAGLPIENASRARDVAITFDDGHLSNYTTAWPMLAGHGFSGNFFIVAAWVGAPDRIGAPQLREMRAAGMSIGSHGMTHSRLDLLPDSSLEEELKGSKDRLEDFLGAEVAIISVPHGRIDRRVLECALRAGYRYICTSTAGLMRGGPVVPRLSVTSFTDERTIEGYARRNALLLGRTRAAQSARVGLKRLIGVRYYEALSRRILGTP